MYHTTHLTGERIASLARLLFLRNVYVTTKELESLKKLIKWYFLY